jgi:hypothetical protein
MTSPRDLAGIAARNQRLKQDRQLLGDHYPEINIEVDERRGTARALGPISIDRPDGSVERIQVRIEFNERYPGVPPRSYDAERRWGPDPDRHIEHDCHLCLFLAGVDSPDLGDDQSLLDYMRELTGFLRQQIILDSLRRHDPTARFPGPEWAHGAEAYAVYAARMLGAEPAGVAEPLWRAVSKPIDRTGPCPCGSGQPHERCHLAVSKRLRRALYEARNGGAPFDRLTFDELMVRAPQDA